MKAWRNHQALGSSHSSRSEKTANGNQTVIQNCGTVNDPTAGTRDQDVVNIFSHCRRNIFKTHDETLNQLKAGKKKPRQSWLRLVRMLALVHWCKPCLWLKSSFAYYSSLRSQFRKKTNV